MEKPRSRDSFAFQQQMLIGPSDRFAHAYPDEFAQNFLNVDFARLAAHGRRNGILDVDNCLLRRKERIVTSETVVRVGQLLTDKVLDKICLVSNVSVPRPFSSRRVASIARQLGIPGQFICAYLTWIKPHPWPFQWAMKLMGSHPGNTFMVGDQLFSDVRGGNRLGLYTIHVPPLWGDSVFTGPKRAKERRAFAHWRQFVDLPGWIPVTA